MKIAVIGSGVMGAGLAQILGGEHEVVLKVRDVKKESALKAIATINKNLERSLSKGKITQEAMDKTIANIHLTQNMEDLKDCDLVIEAIAEDINVKFEIFKELDKICDEKTILATNTSSLSITEIASATNRPEKVIGMHFFNPVPVMALVEVIKGFSTSDETKDFIINLTKSIGKTPVEVAEGPGFVVNRILIPMINEAVGIYADSFATPEDIDTAMKLGANHPMGPLALGDLIGWDVCLAIMEVLYRETGDSKYRPHVHMRKLVRANKLGRKTKQGIYKYN